MLKTIGVLGAALLAVSSVASAQSQADFEQCSREAEAAAAASLGPNNPSALPGATVGGSTMTAPGSSEANRQPNAAGRISGNPGSPGTTAGAISGGGAGTSRDLSVTQGTLSSGTTDAAKDDPVYQQTYRDCLKRRGF
jgi:hypothetical protein